MGNFYERLKGHVTKGGVLHYVFGSLAQANVILDKVYKDRNNGPIGIVIQPTDGRMETSPWVKDEQHLIMGYGEGILQDYDAEEVQEVVERLKGECVNLIGRLNGDGMWEPVVEVEYNVMFDAMDANLVIVLMDFRLMEAVGRCVE